MDKSSEKIAFGTAPPKRCFEAIYKIIEFRSGTGIFGSIQSHGNQAPSATAARAGAAGAEIESGIRKSQEMTYFEILGY